VLRRRAAPPQSVDVAVVGAGAAGVGCAVVLRHLGIDCAVLERHAVGASFERWPAETRFLTPSFPGNAFGMLDLNAVALTTSPAFSLNTEHPTGPAYAAYLRGVAQHFKLPIHSGVDVTELTPQPAGGFLLETSRGAMRARIVIWAAGEFQYPRRYPFPGAEHGTHTADVASWREVAGDDIAIIGGYESGMDAACHLVALGKRVRVFDSAPTWESESGDPSLSLSPYTRDRMEVALSTERLTLTFDTAIAAIERDGEGYVLVDERGARFATPQPPLLATGFTGSLALVAERFDWSERGNAQLTEHDESTITPGLFVSGPLVRHPGAIFCFIYKFRQRFAVIAEQIALRLGVDTAPLDVYRTNTMFLDDLSCCDEACAC